MKTVMLCLSILLAPAAAHAKLNLKDQKVVKEQQPKVDKAVAAYKEVCGCAPKVDVNWEAIAGSSDKEDYRESAMGEASSCLDQLVYAVGEQGKLCAEFKKEVCAGISKVNLTFNGKGKEPWTKLDKASKTLTLSVTGGASGCE
ncbi:MAG: hypothetical protein EOP09_18025, partial [Proteobacteria bacterium]